LTKVTKTGTVQKKQERCCNLRTLQLLPDVAISSAERKMLCRIVHSETWDKNDLKEVHASDKRLFCYLFQNGLSVLAYDDRDLFIERVLHIYTDEMKNSLWQSNHVKVLCAISKLTLEKNRFPTRLEISIETGLSKQTINKHLKDYFGSEEYNSRKDEYLIMRERVVASVFKSAVCGDAKAARVFLDATNQFTEQPKIQNQQNNFIQINGLTITQEELKQLPAGKLTQLQKILSAVNKPLSKTLR
jgi:hypothetical protein